LKLNALNYHAGKYTQTAGQIALGTGRLSAQYLFRDTRTVFQGKIEQYSVQLLTNQADDVISILVYRYNII